MDMLLLYQELVSLRIQHKEIMEDLIMVHLLMELVEVEELV